MRGSGRNVAWPIPAGACPTRVAARRRYGLGGEADCPGLVAYFVVIWIRGPKPEPVEDAQARQRVRALETDVENLRRRIEYPRSSTSIRRATARRPEGGARSQSPRCHQSTGAAGPTPGRAEPRVVVGGADAFSVDPELGLHAGLPVARHVAVEDVDARRQVDRAAVRVGAADLELEAVDVPPSAASMTSECGSAPSCVYSMSTGPAAIR